MTLIAAEPLHITQTQLESALWKAANLACRGIKATIPDRADQKQNRANKGPVGGRPAGFDSETTKAATSSNAASSDIRTGGESQCDPTKPPATTRQTSPSTRP